MERRVESLEGRVGASDVSTAELKADLRVIKEDLGEIKSALLGAGVSRARR